MSKIAFHRALAGFVARSAVGLSRWGGADHGRQDKSVAFGPAHVFVCAVVLPHLPSFLRWRFRLICKQIQTSERHRSWNRADP
jgi:hypothetical protein